ncbi:MAG: beta-galactosidase [Terracidiphilus sp.]
MSAISRPKEQIWCFTRNSHRTLMVGIAFTLFLTSFSFAQDTASVGVWQVPKSTGAIPHFQTENGHQVLYVDNVPYSMLAVEIPWWDLRVGHYREDEAVYDGLYAKAKELGVNTLKVPVKWSMTEPEKSQYDFSYVDHAIKMAGENHLHLVLDWFGHYASDDGNIYGNLSGELYAPLYIVKDEKTYPRAIDGDGIPHHNSISYDSPAVIDREVKAFLGFMLHLKNADPRHVVVGIQLENEISVFGSDRHNPKLFRDHSPESNRKFAAHGFTDDLKYSAWDMSTTWIKPLTEAAHAAYPIPIFHNYVGGSVGDGLIGGSPGEDVQTYMENCPSLSFIAVNAYFCAEWHGDSCGAPSQAATTELRATLKRYAIWRNIPAVTETNSGASLVAPRFAYVALGEFGVPIFAPWSLTMSYPESRQPYLLPDGRLSNGAFQLRDAYQSLEKALPQILLYAGTDKLKVFQAPTRGQQLSVTDTVNGLPLHITGSSDGQAIVIHPAEKQFLIVGYNIDVSLKQQELVWPFIQNLHVQRVHWSTAGWVIDGDPFYGIDQASHTLWIGLEYPQAVLVTLP